MCFSFHFDYKCFKRICVVIELFKMTLKFHLLIPSNMESRCFIFIHTKYVMLKVGDNSLIIHKSAYHLFSLLISKRGFSFLQTRKKFGKILSGNYRFLIPVIRVTPHSCACLLHRASHFYAI